MHVTLERNICLVGLLVFALQGKQNASQILWSVLTNVCQNIEKQKAEQGSAT